MVYNYRLNDVHRVNLEWYNRHKGPRCHPVITDDFCRLLIRVTELRYFLRQASRRGGALGVEGGGSDGRRRNEQNCSAVARQPQLRAASQFNRPSAHHARNV